jgi:glucosamine--fructose-6-phosphate aminotransferase (isomerizing)
MQQLLSEIMEQPAVLRRLLQEEYPHLCAVADEIRRRDVRAILIAARGSSDNAATYAKYLFGTMNRLPVMLAAPSLYTLYQRPPRLDKMLVMGISQSGASPDVVTVIEDARRQGMLTVALTNFADSRLAQAAEHVVPLHAGEELSIAATKTYTAELMALALLAVALLEDEAALQHLRALPDALDQILATSPEIARHVERYRYMEECAVIGRGYNYATAFELALKLKELTYVRAAPYSSADFRHGPIAVVEKGYPVLVIMPYGQAFADMMSLLQDLEHLDAESLVISDDAQALRWAQTPLKLPVAVEEWLSPITTVVVGQLFTYHLALAKNLDPERPRGLRKVTETF